MRTLQYKAGRNAFCTGPFLAALVLTLMAPGISYSAQTAEGFIQSWAILGQLQQPGGAAPTLAAIRRDYLTNGSNVTEKNLVPAINQALTIAFGGAAASTGYLQGTQPYVVPTIFAYAAPADGVDYNVVFGDVDNIMCYAWTFANNKTGANWKGFIGVASDDSIQVVVNGLEVGAISIPRGWGAANEVQNAYPVTLFPGINLVMIKVFEGGGGFGLRARLQTDATVGVKTAAGSVPDTQVSFSETGTFAYPPLPTASAARAIAGLAQYVPGATPGTTVTITVTPTAAGPVSVSEVVPAGLVISNVSASVGTANVTGQTISWSGDLGGASPVTITYLIAAPTGVCGAAYQLTGSLISGQWDLAIGGQSTLTQASDGWENAPINWGGSITVGDDLPLGRTDYFNCNQSYVIYGDGHDIWDAADDFHFLYAYVRGAFTISADVRINPPNTNVWAKGGLMVRANATAGSPYVILAVTNGGPDIAPNGNMDITIQWRDAQDTGAAWDGATGAAANNDTATLILARAAGSNDIATGYNDLEGANVPFWQSHTAPNIDPAQINLVGLCFTSHATGVVGNCTFKNVALVAPTVIVPTIQSAIRSISQTTYVLGDLIRVQIALGHGQNGNVVVTETVPAGWLVQNISNGGTQTGDTVTWNLNLTGNLTLAYEVYPRGGSTMSGVFQGQYTDPALSQTLPIGGASSITRNETVAVAPFAYWPLNDGTGATADDAVGTNNGALNGTPAWAVTGKFGGALTFDGTDDWVDLPEGLVNSRNGAISLWCNTTRDHGTDNANRAMMFYANQVASGGNGYGGENEIHLNFEANTNTNQVELYMQGGPNIEIATGAGLALNNGQWHHIVASWSPTNVTLYSDGAERVTVANTSNNFICSGFIALGKPVAQERRYQGQLDDVRVYAAALTPEQVAALFSGTPVSAAPAAPTGLAANRISGPRLLVSWAAPAGSVLGYIVSRKVGDTGPFIDYRQVGSAISITDPNVADGTKYTYKVHAYNDMGESPDSAQFEITPQASLGVRHWNLYSK